jgi:hypothetical protein
MGQTWRSPLVCVLGLLLAFTASGAAQDTGKAVAVVPFADRVHGWSGTGTVVTDRVVGKLRDAQGLRVLPRSQVQDVLNQTLVDTQGVLDFDEAQKVGRTLGAAYLVMGEVDEFDWQAHAPVTVVAVVVATIVQQTATVALKGQVFDVAGGRVLGTPDAEIRVTQLGGPTWDGPWWSIVSVDNFDSQLIGKATAQAVDKFTKWATGLMK